MSVDILDEGMRHQNAISIVNDTFHKYVIEWTPQYLSYSVDG